jgi:hypothetical protein
VGRNEGDAPFVSPDDFMQYVEFRLESENSYPSIPEMYNPYSRRVHGVTAQFLVTVYDTGGVTSYPSVLHTILTSGDYISPKDRVEVVAYSPDGADHDV